MLQVPGEHLGPVPLAQLQALGGEDVLTPGHHGGLGLAGEGVSLARDALEPAEGRGNDGGRVLPINL